MTWTSAPEFIGTNLVFGVFDLTEMTGAANDRTNAWLAEILEGADG